MVSKYLYYIWLLKLCLHSSSNFFFVFGFIIFKMFTVTFLLIHIFLFFAFQKISLFCMQSGIYIWPSNHYFITKILTGNIQSLEQCQKLSEVDYFYSSISTILAPQSLLIPAFSWISLIYFFCFTTTSMFFLVLLTTFLQVINYSTSPVHIYFLISRMCPGHLATLQIWWNTQRRTLYWWNLWIHVSLLIGRCDCPLNVELFWVTIMCWAVQKVLAIIKAMEFIKFNTKY